jgi:hypothetical protein
MTPMTEMEPGTGLESPPASAKVLGYIVSYAWPRHQLLFLNGERKYTAESGGHVLYGIAGYR